MSHLSSSLHPPSEGRLASAARLGMLLHSPILRFGSVSILTGLSGIALVNHSRFFALSDFSAALGNPNPRLFLLHQLHQLFFLSLLLAIPVFAMVTATILLTRKQKRNGQTNVPIDPGFSTRRDDLLASLLTLLVGSLAVIAMYRNSGFTYGGIIRFPQQAATQLITLIFWSAVTFGAVAIPGGILQWTLRKVRLFQHLSLSSSEMKKELQLQGKSPTRNRMQAD